MTYVIYRHKWKDGELVIAEYEPADGASPYSVMYDFMMLHEDDYPYTTMAMPQYDSFRHCWFWEDWMIKTMEDDIREIGVTELSFKSPKHLSFTFDSMDFDGFNGDVETTFTIDAGVLYRLLCDYRPSALVDRADDYGKHCEGYKHD